MRTEQATALMARTRGSCLLTIGKPSHQSSGRQAWEVITGAHRSLPFDSATHDTLHTYYPAQRHVRRGPGHGRSVHFTARGPTRPSPPGAVAVAVAPSAVRLLVRERAGRWTTRRNAATLASTSRRGSLPVPEVAAATERSPNPGRDLWTCPAGARTRPLVRVPVFPRPPLISMAFCLLDLPTYT